MNSNSYFVFRFDLASLPLASPGQRTAHAIEGLVFNFWTPAWTRLLPYAGAPSYFLLWWIFDRLSLFHNPHYAILTLADTNGRTVHRTCIFPGSFRKAFVDPNSVEIGAIWTHPAWRRRGLAKAMLLEALRALPGHFRYAYYLATEENAPSHALATAAGFNLLGRAQRPNRLFSTVAAHLFSPRPANIRQYSDVTELAGHRVSALQVSRLIQRYVWAAGFCENNIVVDAACGGGHGLGLLGKKARSIVGGDIDHSILVSCRRHYQDRFPLVEWDVQDLPLGNNTVDVLILLEALYYLADPGRFIRECRRVIRPGGHLLLSMPNPELFDFHRSIYSYRYFTGAEIATLLQDHGFHVELLAGDPYSTATSLEHLVRPLKALAARYRLIPSSMLGKRLLRRLVFGRLEPLRSELAGNEAPYVPPVPIPADRPDTQHRILYVNAQK